MEAERVIVRRAVASVRHINKLTLQGIVTTTPKRKVLSSGTDSIVFKIKSNETFVSRGKTIVHENEFVVEALGQVVHKVEGLVKKGGTYVFDGYLRSDRHPVVGGKKMKRIRVRIFHVEKY